jgi:hypothetical protein
MPDLKLEFMRREFDRKFKSKSAERRKAGTTTVKMPK